MSNKIEIVLIEDDTDDVELLQEALDSRGVSYHITLLKDGSAAKTFLRKPHLVPDIVIMDFNLPRVHGREVIGCIRSNAQFSNVPILVLSTSSSKEDIAYAYEAGADQYLIKPSTIESINDTVRIIVQMASAGQFQDL